MPDEVCNPAVKSIEEGALYGAFVIRHREILRGRVGRDVVCAAIDDLGSDAAAALHSVTADGWVPVDAVEGFFDAVATRVGRDAGSLHEEVGAITAQQTILTFWRILMRLTTDAQLVSQVPILYRRTWNRGSLAAHIAKPGHATLTLTGWPGVPEFPVRGVRIAVTQALTMAGRKAVTVRSEREPAGARYSATWLG
jgi:hypothetical protein